MCLELKGSKVSRRSKYVYKGVYIQDWSEKIILVSPYYNKEWKPGVIISDRCKVLGKKYRTQLAPEEQEFGEVNHGIHVFHNKDEAKLVEDPDIVIQLVVDDKDLVSHGWYGDSKNSVYDRVTLTKEEYNRAMKQAKKVMNQERKDRIPF